MSTSSVATLTSPVPLHAVNLQTSVQRYAQKADFLAKYVLDRESLSMANVHTILDSGLALGCHTEMADTLTDGGSAFFPHAYITQCGEQVAAAVHASLLACQKSGKNQILLIGVVHAITDTHKEVRKREMNGDDLSHEPCRGIFGPDLPLPNEDLLSKEYSLDNFIFLLRHAAERMGIEPPKVVMRYPNLVRGQPETLSGIEELLQLTKESIVIATSDLCHHGKAYGQPLESIVPLTSKANELARKNIEKGLNLLAEDDLMALRQHSYGTGSDSVEVGQLVRYLLGPLQGHIHDLKIVDVSDMFEGDPKPSWVSCSLIELKKLRIQN